MLEVRVVEGKKVLIETVEVEFDPKLAEDQIAGALAQADDYEAQAAEKRAWAAEMQVKLAANKTGVDEVKAERVALAEAPIEVREEVISVR